MNPVGTSPTLTVAVMTFNEVETLPGTLGEIADAVREAEVSAEILVIDDGSTDGSGVLAREAATRDPRIRVVSHPVNQGLGEVYRTGFLEARGEFLIFLPADGQFPASVIPSFLEAARSTDLVLGTYDLGDHDSAAGRILNRIERALLVACFGSLPELRGIFMLRRSVIDPARLVARGRAWIILLEMLVRATRSGARFVRVTTPLRPRKAGASKVRNWRTIASYLGQILTLRWKLSAERF